jgi:hypothetical protein
MVVWGGAPGAAEASETIHSKNPPTRGVWRKPSLSTRSLQPCKTDNSSLFWEVVRRAQTQQRSATGPVWKMKLYRLAGACDRDPMNSKEP